MLFKFWEVVGADCMPIEGTRAYLKRDFCRAINDWKLHEVVLLARIQGFKLCKEATMVVWDGPKKGQFTMKSFID